MQSNRCVNCGIPVKYLFTEYGQDNFVLEICSNCKKFTDPYIEQSSIILILDLFLLKPEVYYHLLFNTNHSYQSFNSQLASPAVPPAASIQDDTNKLKSEEASNGNLKAFNQVHLELSLSMYGLILILESTLQALDDLHHGDLFLHSNPIKRMLMKLIGLLVYIFNLISTAVIISRVFNREGSYHHQNPTKQVIPNSIRAIIISFSPGIVMYLTIMIFQNSYGTYPPPRLFSRAENLYLSKLAHAVRIHLGYDISRTFDDIVGIDMDQLGSTELKQILIRNLMGSLSCSVGIAVSSGQSWVFGFVVLSCCAIQKRLITSLFTGLIL